MVKTQENTGGAATKAVTFPTFWVTVLSWGITLLLVAVLILLLLQINPFQKESPAEANPEGQSDLNLPLPSLASALPVGTLFRSTNLDTAVPEGIRQFPIRYTVEEGDSIFAIAKKFDITPQTLLLANYDYFYDDPTISLVPGWNLIIPPIDGLYYEWKEGDTLEKVANKYYAYVEDIIYWPGNGIDVTNPTINPKTSVMIPHGYRVVTWIQPVDFSSGSGATQTIAGSASCPAPENGPIGSMAFQWPVGNHYLSGFDFVEGFHLGIDIAAAIGTPVHASDSGSVVYAGWNDSGYGNLVAIDHNNGYLTVYAHLDSIAVTCGASVYSGGFIGFSGTSGRSTGGHLHFEIRYFSTYINPWQVLP